MNTYLRKISHWCFGNSALPYRLLFSFVCSVVLVTYLSAYSIISLNTGVTISFARAVGILSAYLASCLIGISVVRTYSGMLHCQDSLGSVASVAGEVSRKDAGKMDMLSGAGDATCVRQDKVERRHDSTKDSGCSKELEIEELLSREQIEVDMDAIGALLADKVILITGAAGSIGSEMVRQVAKYQPRELILIDHAETPLHDLRLLMDRQFPNIKSHTIVTSICNAEHMESLFAQYRPEYVFHAAAYKHVPMMEDNPCIAVQNNIRGTQIMAMSAVKYGVMKFVMISTDKAVMPTNVMGCSKRICEMNVQSLDAAIKRGEVLMGNGQPAVTQFVITRFGNVIGSNGSVIPLFKEQIKNGGPVTVTHPDILRYFMLIAEACELVLEAGTMGHGGEIFVFDMGEPIKIVDLAKRMIAMSGAKDVEIQFTGLRPGEKLFEEMLSDKENTIPTPHPKIKVAKVGRYDYEEVNARLERLYDLSRSFDDMAVVRLMKEMVPEFKSQHSKYETLDRES